jgi:hypothetical protein
MTYRERIKAKVEHIQAKLEAAVAAGEEPSWETLLADCEEASAVLRQWADEGEIN